MKITSKVHQKREIYHNVSRILRKTLPKGVMMPPCPRQPPVFRGGWIFKGRRLRKNGKNQGQAWPRHPHVDK